MFGFVKKVFFVGVTILSSLTSVNSLSCISLSCISTVKGVKQDHKFLI